MPASRGNAAADIDEVAENFLSIGQILVRLKANDAAAFDATVRHYGLKPRKAQYLIEVAAAFDGLPMARDRLLALGWTKASVLASHVDRTNVERLLQLAEQSSVHRLKEVLNAGGDDDRKRVLLLYVSDQEFSLIAEALEPFGAKLKNGKLHGTREALIGALDALRNSQA
jgi:hypothetical protein